MANTIQGQFNALVKRSKELAGAVRSEGFNVNSEASKELMEISIKIVELDPSSELLEDLKYKQFKAEVAKHKGTIHELRLRKGLTIQEASNLSGISVARIKRWEANGGGRAAAHEMAILLHVYGRTIEHIDCVVPTKTQIIKAILSGSSAVVDGVISVETDKLIKLMRSEGFNVSEPEVVCEEGGIAI